MTEQDKAFIRTHRAWIESTKLNRIEYQQDFDYNQAKAKILQKQMAIDEKQIELCDDYLQSGIESFNAWCADNGIDPNVEI